MSHSQPENFQDYSDHEFDKVVAILKSQKALPEHSFVNHVAFFTLARIPKQTQIRELFQVNDEYSLHITSLNHLLSSSSTESDEDKEGSDISLPQTMTFAQICLYKVLPCPEANCPNRTREVVTQNQYKDAEYECPFYHHDKDRRRNVIMSEGNEEFAYKANYFEEGKNHTEKDKYSYNYFESMFHPLYYKMFRCKRTYCNSHRLCPFYHHEDEKKAWNNTFNTFVQKERVNYVKDKQKYYDSISPLDTRRQCYSENQSPCKSSGLRIYRNSSANDQRSPKTAVSQFAAKSQKLSEPNSAKIQRSTNKSQYEKAKVSGFYRENSSVSAKLKISSIENIHSSKVILKERLC